MLLLNQNQEKRPHWSSGGSLGVLIHQLFMVFILDLVLSNQLPVWIHEVVTNISV